MSTHTATGGKGHMIAPHGGELIDRTVSGDAAAALAEEAASLPRVRMTEKQTADLDMIASGALSPLTGFMTRADYDPVVRSMHLDNGLPWSLPVTLSVTERPTADRIALEGYAGDLLAVLDVAEVFEADRRDEAARVYRTTEDAHPGVAQIYAEGGLLVGGPVSVFQRPQPDFPGLHMDPVDTRAAFADRGWQPGGRVPDPQPRPPGARVHPEVRAGDRGRPAAAPAGGRDQGRRRAGRRADALLRGAARELLPGRPHDALGVFPAAMRYAGPREAIWHAICRKNYGCSHFIVGRDHAGVGSYYGTYDAQLIFDEFEPGELGIEPMFFEHSFFCRSCGNMGTAKTCPHRRTTTCTCPAPRCARCSAA